MRMKLKDRYRMRKNAERLRNEVLDLLGRSCSRCGYTDARALQIDHVHNNGSKERKIYKGQSMYRRILAVNGNGYQTLCANCNWIKRLEVMKPKQKLVDRLIEHYGEDFKSPLARDLKVNVSTIRRIFNQREAIPYVYQLSIEKLLGDPE